MKKVNWITRMKLVWFLILMPGYVLVLALVKYQLNWVGISVVAAIMALNNIQTVNMDQIINSVREKHLDRLKSGSQES